MLLALLQANAVPLDMAGNLAVIEAAARDAAAAGADLLLTPELFVPGYDPERIHAEFEPGQLPRLREQLAQIARNHGIALIYSLPRLDGDRLNISATLVDAAGVELLDYGKVHLFGDAERAAFIGATEAPGVVQFKGLNLSMVICYDVEFPETVRAAGVRGADVVLVPTALAHGFDEVPQVLVRARALENHVVLAYANHCGVESSVAFGGGSVIVGADGGFLATAGPDATLLYAQLDAETIRATRKDVPYLSERRPELYGEWARES
ncbi:nitrilase [Arthrobacter alpinus]|uniref:nitrilase-related carbon-nitrogen hydrolase n=1 Tax=Arthrobacter alpinus TaxID=656366 RepID=UPI0005CA4038|nr:nitrilase-related carbon-nitrogen hydrolase [Arthrobacter alpinus]ALV44439.1 nitrilase [Arthrobacter alpinus]